MITAERLEELIKQGATIYFGTGFTYVQELNFTNKTKDNTEIDDIEIIDDLDLLAFYNTRTEDRELYRFSELYETKERYDWGHKMTAERTERFEPPMWEEIKDTYEFHFTCQNYTHKRTDGIIETVYTPQCFMFYIHKSEQPNYNRVMIRNYRIYALNIEVFDEPATKENYEKACEIVRDLFNKGGAK